MNARTSAASEPVRGSRSQITALAPDQRGHAATTAASPVRIHTQATARPVHRSAAAGTGIGSQGSSSTPGISSTSRVDRRARHNATRKTSASTGGAQRDGRMPTRVGHEAASVTASAPRDTHTARASTNDVASRRRRRACMRAAWYHREGLGKLRTTNCELRTANRQDVRTGAGTRGCRVRLTAGASSSRAWPAPSPRPSPPASTADWTGGVPSP